MSSSPSTSASSAWSTEPSLEFSMGTTPCFASRRATASKTPSMVVVSVYVAARPKKLRAAACENVPSGPMYAIFSGSCSARHALITSR